MHADFMNGWNMTELKRLVNYCIATVDHDATTGEKETYCQDPKKLPAQ